MINRNPLIAFGLTVVLAVYLLVSLGATARMASDDLYRACRIEVADSLHTGFVTAADISAECGGIMQWIKERPRSAVDICRLEADLSGSDRIEKANVSVLNDGTLLIEVVPMTPVARVFDVNTSYYINAEGKHITASPRYHIDVPVVVGHFDGSRPATRLLPLLDYIASVPELDALVSTVKQEADGDIIIVPAIRGHVINFGDTSLVADKFDRLTAFYRNVMPVRGWETYDTLAVKWRRRVIATRRDKALKPSLLAAQTEEFDDFDDFETMTSPIDSIMPEQ